MLSELYFSYRLQEIHGSASEVGFVVYRSSTGSGGGGVIREGKKRVSHCECPVSHLSH